ncbi:MAG: hypothetical protein ACOXZK_04025 [Bacteroidales bacterium]|jgi:hypothetical protein|nr:hypothetical protein [Bacteroidales bacterium]
MKFKKIVLSLFVIMGVFANAQIIGEDYSKEILRKETLMGISLNTNGYGFDMRLGKDKSYFRKQVWEFGFSVKKHPKEIKARNPFYINSKDFVYGKINKFFHFNAAYGYQQVLNHKPYWGGTEIRYVLFAGANIGLSRPVYLYIIDYVPGTYESNITLERFDPDLHNVDNIYGRGPILKGFDKLKPHLGVYTKAGFNFEFGSDDRKHRSLETGVAGELFINPVEMMAFNKSEFLFISLYLNFHFGTRRDYY